MMPPVSTELSFAARGRVCLFQEFGPPPSESCMSYGNAMRRYDQLDSLGKKKEPHHREKCVQLQYPIANMNPSGRHDADEAARHWDGRGGMRLQDASQAWTEGLHSI